MLLSCNVRTSHIDRDMEPAGRGTITDVDETEVRQATELYTGGLTLAEVRAGLIRLGYPSRSINTIRAKLHEADCQMRRAGRRSNAQIATTIGA